MALASLCGVVDVGVVMVAVVVVMMADAGCPVGGRDGFRCHGLGCGCDGDGAWCGCHVLCNC